MSELSNHLTEEQLVLHYYGDLDAYAEAEAHLAECAVCREEYSTLQRVLNVTVAADVPERDAAYGAKVWTAVRSELNLPAPKRSPFAWLQVPRWAVAGATLAVLVGVAFYAGRVSIQTKVQAPVIARTAAQERVLSAEAGDHLERTQRALVEFSNTGEETRTTRERAEDLLHESRLLRASARQRGDAALADVLSEVERTLTEIANADDDEAPAIRERMREQGTLFKIRMLRTQLTSKQRAAQSERVGSHKL